MAAIVNNSVKAFSTANVSSITTATFAVGGNNRCLWGAPASGAGSPAVPVSVKWGGSGGAGLTKQGTELTVSAFGFLSLWRLIAPIAQTASGYADYGANQDEILILFVATEDTDQTTPNGAVAPATGTASTATVNAVTAIGDLTLDFVFVLTTGGQNTIAVGASQVSIQEIEGADTGAESLGSSKETAVGTSTTMSWAITYGGGTVDGWGIYAFAVKAVAAGSTFDQRSIAILMGNP